MLYKMLDNLLAVHFKSPAADHKLDGLEQAVWGKIHTKNVDIGQPWYDKIVLAFTVPEFRMASLAMALIIGIGAGPVFTIHSPALSSQGMLGMDVFTIESPYLPSNLIGRME